MSYDLEELWKTELEILDVIDRVCRENNLRYSLFAGTLLGAVRHGGFIPWDDDIDIIMPRDDYNRLLQIWNMVAPKDYVLQNKITNNDFSQNFSKIRKKNTTFIIFEYEKSVSYNTGVFVDIFPADRLAAGKIGKTIQFGICAVNLLMSRDFSSGSKGIKGIIERSLLALPKQTKRWLYLQTNRWAQMGGKESPYFVFDTLDDISMQFPATLFENMIEMNFAGKRYSVVREYEEMLRIHFGDYMQLPSKEDRVLKHHPLIIDLNSEYKTNYSGGNN